jgi:hypothetical protein
VKPVFDPKWLPELKEVQVPAIVVGADHHHSLLDDIRRMNRDHPIMEPLLIEPPTSIFTGATSTFGTPNGMTITAILKDMDFSEFAAPDSKSVVNKTLRKKRDANKASQNAKGRKWWEHR